jgi:hypothetical protein
MATEQKSIDMTIRNKFVPEIELLYNIIEKQQSQIQVIQHTVSLMQIKVEEQSQLIVSLETSIRNKDYEEKKKQAYIETEVDLLLNGDQVQTLCEEETQEETQVCLNFK